MFFAGDFHVGVDKVVERGTILSGIQGKIAAYRKLHPVRIVSAKEVIAFLLMLPRF